MSRYEKKNSHILRTHDAGDGNVLVLLSNTRDDGDIQYIVGRNFQQLPQYMPGFVVDKDGVLHETRSLDEVGVADNVTFFRNENNFALYAMETDNVFYRWEAGQYFKSYQEALSHWENEVAAPSDYTRWAEKPIKGEDKVNRYDAALSGIDLDALVDDPDPSVRWQVAVHGYGFETLVNDDHVHVRREVAAHGFGHEKLQNDEHWAVREAVARLGFNSEKFVTDESWHVRLAVAKSGYGYDVLVNDPVQEVSRFVQDKLGEKKGAHAKPADEGRVASSRRTVYNSENTDILATFTQDDENKRMLLGHRTDSGRVEYVIGSYFTINPVGEMYYDEQNEKWQSDVVNDYSWDWGHYFSDFNDAVDYWSEVVIEGSETEREGIENLAKSESWKVRLALAEKGLCQDILVNDEHLLVRQAASNQAKKGVGVAADMRGQEAPRAKPQADSPAQSQKKFIEQARAMEGAARRAPAAPVK